MHVPRQASHNKRERMHAKKFPKFRVFRAAMADSSTVSKESSKDEKAAAKANAGIPKAEFVVSFTNFHRMVQVQCFF